MCNEVPDIPQVPCFDQCIDVALGCDGRQDCIFDEWACPNTPLGRITIDVSSVVLNPSVGDTWPELVLTDASEQQRLEDFINRNIYSVYSTLDWRIETFVPEQP